MNAAVPLPPFAAREIAEARRLAAERGASVVRMLEELSGDAPERFAARLALSLHYPLARIGDLHGWQPAFDALPFAQCHALQVLAMRDAAGALTLVLGDPFDDARLARAQHTLGPAAREALAHPGDIAAYLARHEEGLSALEQLQIAGGSGAATGSDAEDLSFQSIAEGSSEVVRLVRSTLYDALKANASDIHLETGAGGLGIKYRIDGVLVAVRHGDGMELAEQVISRIKVMAQLDIAERRIPQDGRFTVAVRGREIDFRVSIMPSIFGEDAVLRILDKKQLADAARGLTLDSLGFTAPDRRTIRRLAGEPHGMLLVTGPTGSGKTTTLYAAISEINHGHEKIVTIEDPVEYQLPGVLQIPVNEKKGLTFARGLRSILRHDPDRVMVGEIRDAETAQIAIQASLTGHLVFTTVHANNVFDVLGRFAHMGIDGYSFTAALNGIVAQRLVRRNCPHCSVQATPEAERLADAGLAGADLSGWRFMAGRGCGQCRATGYLGRVAIAEILVMTDELAELIITRQPVRVLKDAARRGGTRLLRDVALDLLREGATSLEEVDRVTTAVA
ncbi:GspE/PulE family protein [Pseudorhodoferax soli]|uniref:General secretion pathway protein E n=1 Tax=Pseudorhodoferax soli TaxID=545864 RepID=A0A368XZ94_9BURK|nr:GspE/PulE family protein [Pseudorhodoferax soli]RCW71334.1 general secretion pathway protein E [Pseudorhodoferax soli]